VSTPSAISAGIEIWTWAIAEKPDIEVALIGEVLSAWSDTIRQEKGIFSTSLKYVYIHPLFPDVPDFPPVTTTHSITRLITARPTRTSSIAGWSMPVGY
jgi:phosphatidylinositol 4-kinase